MSSAGVTLVLKGLLLAEMIIAAAIVRALVGPGRKRGRTMLAGTLGGISLGVLVAHQVSKWLDADVSVIGAVFGIQLGWVVSWFFARQIPREAD